MLDELSNQGFLRARVDGKVIYLIDLLCLTPLSEIFQLYHGNQFLGLPEENHRPWASSW
jgi:hypothetical protein